MQTFTVPTGITAITITLYGAAGGSSTNYRGGYGAMFECTMAVTAGTEMMMMLIVAVVMMMTVMLCIINNINISSLSSIQYIIIIINASSSS